MDTFEAIAQRRSIRKFKDAPVSEDLIKQVLNAAIQAPSGKNVQPWRFVVVRQDKRAEMVRVMREGIANLKDQGINIGSSEWTAKVMEHAPVTLFVFNTEIEGITGKIETVEDWMWTMVNVQSIGAAIQNLLLAAQDLGLGTLWICDVFSAYEELCTWLGQGHPMIAAIALGYPDEAPAARPRKSFEDVVVWF